MLIKMCRILNIPFYVSLVIYGISHNLQWISDIEISLQYSYSKENKMYRGTTGAGKNQPKARGAK